MFRFSKPRRLRRGNLLNYPDGSFDVDRLEGLGVTRSQREVAHFALAPAWIAAAAAGDDPVLEDFVQYAVMKRFPQPGGE